MNQRFPSATTSPPPPAMSSPPALTKEKEARVATDATAPATAPDTARRGMTRAAASRGMIAQGALTLPIALRTPP